MSKNESLQVFSTTNFYGMKSRHGKTMEGKLNDIFRIPQAFKSRINGPTICWKTFFRQNEAFDFADKTAPDICVFSFESTTLTPDTSSGQRQFVATSRPLFWHYYQQLHSQQRHHYEIIREDSPCKLYFDLEFATCVNPGIHGQAMVDILVQYVCYQVQRVFNIDCKKTDVLNLDSSSSSKFSCHLIFQHPKLIFDNNVHAGNFVKYIFSLLWNAVFHNKSRCIKNIITTEKSDFPMGGTPESLNNLTENGDVCCVSCSLLNVFTLKDLQSLIVVKKDGEKTMLCDLGVYTRNRNFRLFLSSKLYKNKPLLVSDNNQFLVDRPGFTDEELFYSSLVSSQSLKQESFLTFDGQAPSSQYGSNKDLSKTFNNRDRVTGFQGQDSLSPYPEVDMFISSLVRDGSYEGSIRRWSCFPATDTVIYEISGYRWCGRVGRHHASNNIMYVVDLRKGVYYQKCYDPECQAANYRSNELPLPDSCLLGKLFESYFSDGTDEEDSLLVEAAINVEREVDAVG